MSKRDIDIADMQCWIFRMAQEKWNIPPEDCADLFKKYDLKNTIFSVSSPNVTSCFMSAAMKML